MANRQIIARHQRYKVAFYPCSWYYHLVQISLGRGLVVKLAYHVSLSRRRSPVRIRSGPPAIYTILFILYSVFIMRPGEGEVVLILDTQHEIEALEMGLFDAGFPIEDTDPSHFPRQVFLAGHEYKVRHGRYDWKGDPSWVRKTNPELAVTPENVESIRVVAEATVAKRGLILTSSGRRHRRVAKSILNNLQQSQ